jgi:tetratricopeptide (TPR) repeat protein
MAKKVKANPKAKKAVSAKNQPSNNRTIYTIFIILAFILYGQTISYDYALDDSIVIKKNEFTKQGIKGIPDILSNDTFVGFFGKKKNLVAGGRYRPLSVVSFAIEVELFGLEPGISHFINILLYALTAIVLFKILNLLFRRFQPKRWYFSIPFLSTLFFLAHPIHTEVVANIKGRDEIMILLGSLLALWYTLKYLDSKSIKYLIYSFVAFFLAFMSKENTVTFLAVIPLAVLFFTKHSVKDNLISMIPLLLATGIFLGIRQQILGSFSTPVAAELMNNPFLNATEGEKFATIFYTLLIYLKLLIFPHPLTYDYYPKQIPIIDWGDVRAWGSLLIYLALLLPAIYYFVRIAMRRIAGKGPEDESMHWNLMAFLVLLYMSTLSVVSNLVFPVGTFMNERFIYISSISYMILLAWVISDRLPHWIQNLKQYQSLATGVLVVLLLAYSVKSIARNRAWKDDPTLFTTDVETSTNSAKGNAAAASIYRTMAQEATIQSEKNKYYEKTIKHFTQAITVYPGYFDVCLDLGVVHYRYNKNLGKTLEYFKKAFEINHTNPKVYQFINAIFNEVKQPQKKLEFYLMLDELKPDLYDVSYSLGTIYGKELNQLAQATIYLEKAVEINPNGADALKDLSVAYGMGQRYEESIEMSKRALTFKPKDAQIYINISINYRNLGEEKLAEEYYQQAVQLDPKYKQQ